MRGVTPIAEDAMIDDDRTLTTNAQRLYAEAQTLHEEADRCRRRAAHMRLTADSLDLKASELEENLSVSKTLRNALVRCRPTPHAGGSAS